MWFSTKGRSELFLSFFLSFSPELFHSRSSQVLLWKANRLWRLVALPPLRHGYHGNLPISFWAKQAGYTPVVCDCSELFFSFNLYFCRGLHSDLHSHRQCGSEAHRRVCCLAQRQLLIFKPKLIFIHYSYIIGNFNLHVQYAELPHLCLFSWLMHTD